MRQKIGQAFRLEDGTGEVLVYTSAEQANEVRAGSYALVVGRVSGAGQLQIKAHKVRGGEGLGGAAWERCLGPDGRRGERRAVLRSTAAWWDVAALAGAKQLRWPGL